MLKFEVLDTNKNMYFIVNLKHINDKIWEIEYPISSGGTEKETLDFDYWESLDFLEKYVFINDYYTIKWGNTSYLLFSLLGASEEIRKSIKKRLKELEKIQNEYNQKVQKWLF